jgi:hypothetical protein
MSAKVDDDNWDQFKLAMTTTVDRSFQPSSDILLHKFLENYCWACPEQERDFVAIVERARCRFSIQFRLHDKNGDLPIHVACRATKGPWAIKLILDEYLSLLHFLMVWVDCHFILPLKIAWKMMALI